MTPQDFDSTEHTLRGEAHPLSDEPLTPQEERLRARVERVQASLRKAATELAAKTVRQRAISAGLATPEKADEVIYNLSAPEFRKVAGEFTELSRVDFHNRIANTSANPDTSDDVPDDAKVDEANEHPFLAVQEGEATTAKSALEAGANANWCFVLESEYQRTELVRD